MALGGMKLFNTEGVEWHIALKWMEIKPAELAWVQPPASLCASQCHARRGEKTSLLLLVS